MAIFSSKKEFLLYQLSFCFSDTRIIKRRSGFMSKIKIINLHASVNNTEILKGIDLEFNTGEVHALLGPNGHGKSTLLNVIMGHPKYVVTQGSITLDGEDVLAMSVDARARKGLFLALQYPQEIPGVSISDFLKSAINARNAEKNEKPVSLYKFIKELEKSSKEVGFNLDMVHRSINEGFSGGEKKRNEILQMLMLKPTFGLLDEIDSGLDVDGLKYVAEAVNSLKNDENGLIIVSHYARLYNLIKPTHVHVIVNGRVAVNGDASIIEKIDSQGYEWIKTELGIEIQKAPLDEKKAPVVLGDCAVKVATKNVENY